MNNAVNHAALSSQSEQAGFAITVLFTTAAETLDALRTAAALAVDLNARVNLVNVQAVPYPLPLDRPPVYVEFLAERLRAVAKQVSVAVEIHLYFGRNVAETLASVLADNVLVVGSAGRWWSASQRLARGLRRRGHQVIVTDGCHWRPNSMPAGVDAVHHQGELAHS